MGSGPFRFKEYQVRQSISGVRNPDYYRPGLPYLDPFSGIFAEKQAVRVSAIRAIGLRLSSAAFRQRHATSS